MGVDERNEVVVVLAPLWKEVNETQIAQRLHHDTVALKVAVSAQGAHFVTSVVMSALFVFVLHFGVLLHVPDEAAFFGVAGTRDVEMVVEHDLLRGPRGVVHALRLKQEVQLVVEVQNTIRDGVLVEVSVNDSVGVTLRQLENVGLFPHVGLGVGGQDSDLLLLVHQVELVLMEQ